MTRARRDPTTIAEHLDGQERLATQAAAREAAREKKPTKRGAFALNKRDQAERLEFTRATLARVRSPYQVVAAIMKRYDVSEPTAKKLLKATRDFLARDYRELDREQMRAEMRETLNHVTQLALARTKVVKDKGGVVVRDDREYLPSGAPNPNFGMPVVRADPDLGHALQACRELIHLDQLQEEVKATIKIEGEVAVIPDLKSLGADAAAALSQFVRALSPNRDPFTLAGAPFVLSGGDVSSSQEEYERLLESSSVDDEHEDPVD